MKSSIRRENGLLFIADDDDWKKMKKARQLTQKLNKTNRKNFKKINKLVQKLFGVANETTFLNPPFYCDYGKNIKVGNNCFINYNCTILDNAEVIIGDNCMIAPNVSLYTAGHPIHPYYRNKGYEYGIKITIGDNVWIGGNSIICPGVNIGNNVVIGAGSIVTKDIPDWSLACGNPCKVIKKITDEDKLLYYKDKTIDNELLNIDE